MIAAPAGSPTTPSPAEALEAALRESPPEALEYGRENRGRYHHTLALLAGLRLPAAAEVLDAGVYPGHLARSLQRLLGARVTGAGFRFPAGFRAAMQGAAITLVEADLEREPFPRPAAAFDLALATEILEHFWNPAFFLGEMFRLLRPGGTLLLSTPNLVDARNRLRMLAGRPPLQHLFGIGRVFCMNEWVHRREYAPLELRAMLEASGFTDVRMHTRTPTLREGARGPQALIAPLLNHVPGLGGTIYATAHKPSAATESSCGPGIDRASLSPDSREIALAPGAPGEIHVRIVNAGTTCWQPGGGRGCVLLGAHLTDLDGRILEQDFARAALEEKVAPGGATAATLRFVLPAEPGVYLLVVDLVREGERWFGQDGSPAVHIVLRAR